ncbi:hypothetical protein GLAREA_10515 [Glarea lozoyensis ATCC 20868]|uniref:Protein kinase domain-containing protein n=1 Tax=Glarea lozoyensis (strain ATCC 20868 / MF5171) TaxID=1116229 RepID=S3DAU7_GLAL2|nr:uncharacterized protein GLAREA_10515 [Glarea lozoyensis ATCC 20868]EPE34820.1 hypothetical protein GLAREA_10515 [Glarea lozoyensis ATCC 20868]
MDDKETSSLEHYVVSEIGFSQDDENSYLEVRRYNKRFYIHIKPENLEGSARITEEYLRFINAERRENFPGKDEEVEETPVFVDEDFYDWALKCCSPLFQKLAPAPEPELQKMSLSEYYNAETSHYDLHAINETLTPIIKLKVPGFSSPGAEVNRSTLHTSWPVYRPEEVLLNIKNASQALSPSPSVAIIEDELQRVMGILLTYIDCEFTTLSCAAHANTPNCLKQKWADQLTETLALLHQAGIVWGDAKPDNVLIARSGT